MTPLPRWTQARVREGKALATTRVLELLTMTHQELSQAALRTSCCTLPAPRETLQRRLVIEALDRAFPDTLSRLDQHPPPVVPPVAAGVTPPTV